MSGGFLNGIVEGFYGRQWSWAARADYADYLDRMGLNSYLYCPKGDPWLRKRWREPWPETVESHLRTLAAHYRERNLHWGVGLSPYALYREYSAANRKYLRSKIERINELGGDLLAVLFDDMPGDRADLAGRQGDIVGDIEAWSDAGQILVCPTYYTFDRRLERHFGPRPDNYWESLGARIPERCHLFWTGNEVRSSSIEVRDIEKIATVLGRKPCLWDNYPVNDGERASRFLYLDPLSRRDRGLKEVLTGHFCNPMNQACLSRYPLTGLAALYGAPARTMEICFGPELARRLHSDRKEFQVVGLDGMSESDREGLARVYEDYAHPAAAEVVDWLRGGYRFDPDCLTD